MDVLHPVEIGLGIPLGHELDAPVAHRLDGGLRKRLHRYEPLRRNHRLDRRTAAVALAHIVAVVLDAHQIAEFF